MKADGENIGEMANVWQLTSMAKIFCGVGYVA